jgi:hypothetical protein
MWPALWLEKKFPLPEQGQSQFETVRELVGLFKQGPLESDQEFAERVVAALQRRMHKRKLGKGN